MARTSCRAARPSEAEAWAVLGAQSARLEIVPFPGWLMEIEQNPMIIV